MNGAGHYKLAFAIRADETGSAAPTGRVAGLGFGFGGKTAELTLTLAPARTSLEEAVPGDGGTHVVAHTLTMPLANNTWVSVVVDVQLGTPPTVSVSFDGATVLIPTALGAAFDQAGSPVLELGILSGSVISQPWTVHYDNVTLD